MGVAGGTWWSRYRLLVVAGPGITVEMPRPPWQEALQFGFPGEGGGRPGAWYEWQTVSPRPAVPPLPFVLLLSQGSLSRRPLRALVK